MGNAGSAPSFRDWKVRAMNTLNTQFTHPNQDSTHLWI
jgi:hypothetical protein